MSVYVALVHMVSGDPEEGIESPVTEVTSGSRLSCGCQELKNLGTLGKLSALLTNVPSLHAPSQSMLYFNIHMLIFNPYLSLRTTSINKQSKEIRLDE